MFLFPKGNVQPNTNSSIYSKQFDHLATLCVTPVHCSQEAHSLIITELYGNKIEAYHLVTIIGMMAMVSYPAANIYHSPSG